MKRHKVDSSRERRALISLITSSKYLAKASKILDLQLVESPHYKQVAEWCLEHWERYKKAPGNHIEDIYQSWAEGNENEDLVGAIHEFLDGLSKEYAKAKDPQNIPFLLEELADLMKIRKLQRVKDDLEYSLLKGDGDSAEKALTQYRLVSLEEDEESNPMRADWAEVFSNPLDPIIEFEGDAGRFFNAAFTRDSLVAIQAPEKSGKTWWLIEAVIRALRARRKVALFQCGDLSRRQLRLRFGIRWASLPLWDWQQRNGVLVPSGIELDDSEEFGYKIDGTVVKFRDVVNEVAVRKGLRKFRRACGIHRESDYIMDSVHPTCSINVAGIENILDRWKIEKNFIPDLIAIDYADILAPEEGRISKRKHEHDRNVINETWMALRRLAQERHALVLTATQASAKAYRQKLQTMSSFSEDKRKLAHVTGMFALNQSAQEKDSQGMRLNWIVLREAPFNIARPLYVGTCYALGRALCSAKMGSGKITTKED